MEKTLIDQPAPPMDDAYATACAKFAALQQARMQTPQGVAFNPFEQVCGLALVSIHFDALIEYLVASKRIDLAEYREVVTRQLTANINAMQAPQIALAGPRGRSQ